jgi:hypothetical protein
VGVLSKVEAVEAEADSPEALRNGGLLTPVASSKIEPGLVKARGKSGTSLHFLLISLLGTWSARGLSASDVRELL